MVKIMFSVVFSLLNIIISAYRIEIIERCKPYSTSLVIFGLKIAILCSGEYAALLKWKFWKCIMEMLIPYYSWSQGSALLCWTQKKLLVDFCQGDVAAGAVPQNSLSFWHGSTVVKIKFCRVGCQVRDTRCWGTLCHLLLVSQRHSWRGRASTAGDVGSWRSDCAPRIVQRRLLLLKKPPKAFILCLLAISLWPFPGFSVRWDEALGVPGCRKQSSPALPSAPAKHCHQHRAQHPRDYCFWHVATAEVHCQNQNFWPEFFSFFQLSVW